MCGRGGELQCVAGWSESLSVCGGTSEQMIKWGVCWTREREGKLVFSVWWRWLIVFVAGWSESRGVCGSVYSAREWGLVFVVQYCIVMKKRKEKTGTQRKNKRGKQIDLTGGRERQNQ